MSPWPVKAIRQFLLGDTAFNAACEGRIGSRLPSDMTKPFIQVRIIGNIPLSDTDFAKSPLMQVDAWVPTGRPTDPEDEAWTLAEAAAALLTRARNVTYGSMTWKGRLTDGPIPNIDKSRGDATPLYGALIRVELKTHTR